MRKSCSVGALSIIIFVLIFMIGCSENQPTVSEPEDIVVVDNPVDSKDVVDTREDLAGKIPSPISGIYVEKERTERRPFAVMFDNMVKARPQAGLDQAEIVYEFLAEGLITRYMGIFLINEPDTIGSVRSARPYFLDRALEYDAIYVHVGGSEQAKRDIKTLKMADVDALSRNSTIFWRKNHKKAPHNMYTSTEAIRKAANESKYNQEGVYEKLKFNVSDVKPNGTTALKLSLPYSKNYTAIFIYNEEEGIYYREINGGFQNDEISKKQLTGKNIIIQKAATKIIDSEGRLEVEMIGKGEGYYLTQGEKIEITWEKKTRKSITRYFDKAGKEIQLNPGVTWIQVVPQNMNPIFE